MHRRGDAARSVGAPLESSVVVVSAEASEYDPLQTGPLLKAVEVLPKPVEVSHLLETVTRVLGCH